MALIQNLVKFVEAMSKKLLIYGTTALFEMRFVCCLSKNSNFVKIKRCDSFTHCTSNFSYKHS